MQNLSEKVAKMDNDNILMRSELENELELLKREKNTVDKQLDLLKGAGFEIYETLLRIS